MGFLMDKGPSLVPPEDLGGTLYLFMAGDFGAVHLPIPVDRGVFSLGRLPGCGAPSASP